jgi:lysophospholipase L1-like esterase
MIQFQVSSENVRQLLAAVVPVALLFQFAVPSLADDGLATSKAPPQAKAPTTVVPVSRSVENWMARHDNLVKKVRSSHPDIVFFGDSITEGMNVALLHKIISPKAANFGLGGDRTENLLWRLRNGEMDFSAPLPQAFVVLIGTNNISQWPGNPSNTDQEIYLGVQADLNEIKQRAPGARILLLSILPRDRKPGTDTRKRVEGSNALIKGLADNKQIWYADIGAALLEADGSISPEVMSDFLHPTPVKGYELMFGAIKPHLDQLLSRKKTQTGT